MKYFLFISALVLSVSCSDRNYETVNMRVNHHQQTAIGEAPQLVYLVQEGDDIGTARWKYFYDGITGFEFELGYIYDLSVQKRTVDNPPADGSSINYILKEVISKEKAAKGLSFSITLKPTGISNVPTFVSGNVDTGFTLLHTTNIRCNNLCEQLSQELESSENLTGIFQHVDSGTIKLTGLKNSE